LKRLFIVATAYCLGLPAAAYAQGKPGGVIEACSTNGSDGFAGAPIATIQYPAKLNNYSAKPPWCSAGIGYAVGIPTAQSLSDPVPRGTLANALAALGGTLNAGAHEITFSGVDNITIQGWDFSLGGGYDIRIASSGAAVKNNNFKVGSNLRPLIFVESSAKDATIVNNVFDGAGLPNNPAGGLIRLGGQGTTTLKYNLIQNAYYQFIQASTSGVGSSDVQLIEYNVFENAGLGAPNGAHGDWIQDVSSTPGISPWKAIEINFNTFIQNNPTAATQGLSIFYSAGNTATAQSIGISNNTAVATTNVNYPFLIETSHLIGSAIVNNNYIDLTGVVGSWISIQNARTAPYNGTVTASGNKNMLTGATCTIGGAACSRRPATNRPSQR